MRALSPSLLLSPLLLLLLPLRRLPRSLDRKSGIVELELDAGLLQTEVPLLLSKLQLLPLHVNTNALEIAELVLDLEEATGEGVEQRRR